ncbi:MAG: HAD-IA family hydrolase, partial [Actinomycetota bacterium]
VHEQAWAALFDWFLTEHGAGVADRSPFTPVDYQTYVDGKPRYDGVASFLASRDIDVPWGSPDDPPGDDTVCALGNRKNELFNRVLERDGIEPYAGSVRTLELLARAEVPAAIVSSSRNARAVLDAAGLGDRFEVVVDGGVVADDGLAGKPAPDAYLLGARRLGTDPAATVVVEDATSGVAAGAAGRFGVVIGVDRGAGVEALLGHGATFVVSDLADLLD